MYWREGCSDPTWQSPFCLKNVCWGNDVSLALGSTNELLAKTRIQDKNGNTAVTNCTDGTWCCGSDEQGSCCGSGANKFRLADSIGVSTFTIPPSSSITSVATTTSVILPSITSSAPSTTPSEHSKGLGARAQIGIGVGLAAGTIVVAGLVMILLLRRRRFSQTPFVAEAADSAADQAAELEVPAPELEGQVPELKVSVVELE